MDSCDRTPTPPASPLKLRWQALFYSSLIISLGLWTRPAQAQIQADGTINTIVSPTENTFTITGGTTAGTNLFHSFSEFSVPTGGEAFFDNATPINTIFSRVTGGRVSHIDGLIRANGTASLFLINPAGLIFGENASLSLGGSFLGTTADSVVFPNSLEFSATQPHTEPLLTIHAPIGLNIGADSASIQVNGTGHNLSTPTLGPVNRNNTPTGLQTRSGKTLALVGDQLSLNGGQLSVVNGRLELGAIAGPNLVQLHPHPMGWELDYGQISQFGHIQLTQRSRVEASAAGKIQVQGQTISVQDGSIILLENRTSTAAQGIEIRATEQVEFIGNLSNNSVFTGVISHALSLGNGGDILIHAPRVKFLENGSLRAITFDGARGGNVVINAESTDLLRANLAIRTLDAGDSGSLTIATQRLTIQDAALVSNVNNGSGSAGNIVLNATESVQIGPNVTGSSLISSSTVSANGNAGNITITTPQLRLEDGALISSSTFGAGNAGVIRINASDSIRLSGSGLNTATNIVDPSMIRTAGVLLPDPIRPIFNLPDTVTGSTGEIILNTPQLDISNGAKITVRHDDAGNGGTLRVNADKILLQNGGSLTASTQSGDGGNIILSVQELVKVQNGSFIDTETLGVGDGGNISLETANLIAIDNSEINANAVLGQGGNISITTQGLFLSTDSKITASSQLGVDGVVAINRPEISEVGVLRLPAEPLDISQKIATACDANPTHSFVSVGRGGLPTDPRQPLTAHLLWHDQRIFSNQNVNRSTPSVQQEHQAASSPIEAQGWQANREGNVRLVAQARCK